jgi:hypothetical protein
MRFTRLLPSLGGRDLRSSKSGKSQRELAVEKGIWFERFGRETESVEECSGAQLFNHKRLSVQHLSGLAPDQRFALELGLAPTVTPIEKCRRWPIHPVNRVPRWRRRGFPLRDRLEINPEFNAFLDKSAVGLSGMASIPCRRRHGQPVGARAALWSVTHSGGAGPAQFTLKRSGKSNGSGTGI